MSGGEKNIPDHFLPPQPRKTKTPPFGGVFVTWLAWQDTLTWLVACRVELLCNHAVLRDNEEMFYVYLLENQDDRSWYIGYSANLKQRVERHQKGDGARTTARKKNWELIYYEAYKNEQDAKGRERFLKSGSGRKFLKKQLTHYFGISLL